MRKHSEVTSEEAYQWCETKGGAGYGNDVWENHNHTFGGGDMVGARYLLFEDGGVDSEYYKGLYGPWFKDASVVIHKTTFTFAPTATPAPSAPTLKPTFQPTTTTTPITAVVIRRRPRRRRRRSRGRGRTRGARRRRTPTRSRGRSSTTTTRASRWPRRRGTRA